VGTRLDKLAVNYKATVQLAMIERYPPQPYAGYRFRRQSLTDKQNGLRSIKTVHRM
jgi:hypothetical protein